ncbi:hypothetical protein [Streptomyces spongiae]|nr:hypothetical protein [Streptomyces spongiae]
MGTTSAGDGHAPPRVRMLMADTQAGGLGATIAPHERSYARTVSEAA